MVTIRDLIDLIDAKNLVKLEVFKTIEDYLKLVRQFHKGN